MNLRVESRLTKNRQHDIIVGLRCLRVNVGKIDSPSMVNHHMGIFQFPCPLGFCHHFARVGFSSGGFSFGDTPPGMIYITILSLLAPLVHRWRQGIRHYLQRFLESERKRKKKQRVGVWSWESSRGPTETNATTFPPRNSRPYYGMIVGSRWFFCEPLVY